MSDDSPQTPPLARYDAYAPLRHPAFARFMVGNVSIHVGQAMIATAIGWDLYERTGSALALGWVGLVLFLPVLLFALPAGQVADRYDRRLTTMASLVLMGVSSLGLAVAATFAWPLWTYYALLFGAGCGQAFLGPAKSALLSAMVPPQDLNQAVTWNTGGTQLGFLAGPAVAGSLIAYSHSATPVYALDALAASVFVVALIGVRPRPSAQAGGPPPGWAEVFDGLRFVRDTKLLVAAITLDMFAVLFGGAVALLPIMAKDLLHVGPQGLGVLSTAQSVGAFVMGLLMAQLPPIRRNGLVLLWVVAGFGLSTIGFGLSTNLLMAWVFLALAGALDMISMVIRSQMVQAFTPDAMRGRVAAVHSVFVGTSNELGGFESGLTAQWWGPVRSIVYGGLGTLAIVALVAARVPELRRMNAIKPPEGDGQNPGGGLSG